MLTIRRECCPECNTTQIIELKDGYGCTKCQARFKEPNHKMMYKLADQYISRKVTIEKQMEALEKIHIYHPAYTRKDMKMITGYSESVIRAHFKLYDVHYIRRIHDNNKLKS